MRRRASWFLLAVLLVASLPVMAVADPPDASDRGGAVEPRRPETHPAPEPDPDAAARGSRVDPGRGPDPSPDGPESDRGAGAGSAEPPSDDGQREEGRETREQEQHRKWVESIWTTP